LSRGKWSPTITKSEIKPSIAAVKELMGTNHDALRAILQDLLQEMLEGEMTEALGASKSERAEGRIGYRSGHYNRTLITRVGKLELRVPQDRDGRFSTELFDLLVQVGRRQHYPQALDERRRAGIWKLRIRRERVMAESGPCGLRRHGPPGRRASLAPDHQTGGRRKSPALHNPADAEP
jgi:hypothetical protein